MRIKLNQHFFTDRPYVKIAAIDPGKHIGTAQATLVAVPDKPGRWDVEMVTDELSWPDDSPRLLYQVMKAADVIVCESWRALSVVLADWESALEVIGFVKGQMTLLEEFKHTQLIFQVPTVKDHYRQLAESRGFVDWPGSIHEQDALVHLVGYLMSVH